MGLLSAWHEEVKLIYGSSCCTHGHIQLADSESWDSIIEDFATKVYNSELKGDQIHPELYFKTAQQLADAVMKGLPQTFEFDDPANLLAAELRGNLFQFSGAKNLYEQLEFAAAMHDGDKLKSFNQYLQDIQSVHKDYNVRFLEAEYNNALAGSQMAMKWRNLESLNTEWLEYRTVGDDRVRPKHAELDKLTLRFDSPVWDRIYPPNDWGCRCNVVPGEKPQSPVSDKEAGRLGKEVVKNPVFENNVGKSGVIFKDDHVYFKAATGKIQEFDAVKNYGMKPVGKIMSNKNNLPASIHLDTVDDYHSWWDDIVKSHGVNESDFVLSDPLGLKVLFTSTPDGKKAKSYFRDHILDNKDDRHEIAANLKDVIESPDEVWYFKYKGKIASYNYIKYFKDQPLIVKVSAKDKLMQAETMFAINKEKSQVESRRGVLMYKK